jgi:hypothetical protein
MEYDEDGRPIFGPVVNFTDEDVRLGVEAARKASPEPYYWRVPSSPSLTADTSWAADVPHNYITGIGDCFDWLDHDTKMMVRDAVELNDTDDLGDFAAIAMASPIAKHPRNRQQYKRLGQKLRKRA